MTKQVGTAQKILGDFAPNLVHYTDDVIFGELWEDTTITSRERSLITVAALIAGNHTEQLPFHLNFAKEHGLSETELIEVITHLAFYTGWPNAMSAAEVAKKCFAGKE